MSVSEKQPIPQGPGLPPTPGELFELFLSTLPGGQQANIRESMARGESLTRAAFDFAIANAAAAGDRSGHPAGEEGTRPVGHVDMRGPSGAGDRIKWTDWALPHGTALYAHALPAASPASRPEGTLALSDNDVFTLIRHAEQLRITQVSDTGPDHLFAVAERIARVCGNSHLAERVRALATADRACSP